MEDDDQWRARARASLEAYFSRRSFPRITLSLLLLLTGLSGFLLSYGMLRLGIEHMSLRYPIATLGGYTVLLALIRMWVAVERSRFDTADANIGAHGAGRPPPLPYSRRGTDSWWDWLDIPDIGIGDVGEGCLPAILLGVVLVLLWAIAVAISMAPALIAEAFLDAFLVTALYRRLRAAQKENWLGTALRKTWAPALITAVALAIGGWVLEEMAPGSPSIGKAIQQLRGETE